MDVDQVVIEAVNVVAAGALQIVVAMLVVNPPTVAVATVVASEATVVVSEATVEVDAVIAVDSVAIVVDSVGIAAGDFKVTVVALVEAVAVECHRELTQISTSK